MTNLDKYIKCVDWLMSTPPNHKNNMKVADMVVVFLDDPYIKGLLDNAKRYKAGRLSKECVKTANKVKSDCPDKHWLLCLSFATLMYNE